MIERDRSNDPVRIPRRPIAVPVPGPQPVFFTRRDKPAVIFPEIKIADVPAAEISNVFAIPAQVGRAG